MQEPAEVAGVVGESVQGLEAVNHHQPRLALLEHRRYLPGHARQALAGYRRPEILIEHRRADRIVAEEIQALAETHDLLQWLGNRGEIDCRTPRAPVPEDVLLRDDGLAGPGQPHDQADRVRGQAAAEHGVERLMPAQHAVGHDAASCSGRRSRAHAEQLPDGGRQLRRVQGLRQERVGAGFERLVAGLENRGRDHGHAVPLEGPAQIQAGATRDEKLDDRDRRGPDGQCAQGRLSAEHHLDLESLGREEVLLQFGGVRVTLSQQDGHLSAGDGRAPGGPACSGGGPACSGGGPACSGRRSSHSASRR